MGKLVVFFTLLFVLGFGGLITVAVNGNSGILDYMPFLAKLQKNPCNMEGMPVVFTGLSWDPPKAVSVVLDVPEGQQVSGCRYETFIAQAVSEPASVYFDMVDYYDRDLKSRGWQIYAEATHIIPTGERVVYTKDGRYLQVGFDRESRVGSSQDELRGIHIFVEHN